MDADELRETLKALGWKGSDLARKVGVGTSTVSRWTNGDEIPPWVPAYLGMVGEVVRLHQAYALPIKPADAPATAKEEAAPLRGRAAQLVQRLKDEPELFKGKE